jgi:hypothetical protein
MGGVAVNYGSADDVRSTIGKPFGELHTMKAECGPAQHDYTQGMDSDVHPEGQFANLLFCRQCGDVIRFQVPGDER